MLDDPFITLDKIGEAITFGSNLIWIFVLIIALFLLYMYRYEIRIFIKHGFSDSKNMRSPFGMLKFLKTNMSELERKDLNDKVENLLNKFENPELDSDDIELIENVDNLIPPKNTKHTPPIFRSLKTIKTSSEITYYFVNDGGAIRNFNINPISGIYISVEPEHKLESNGSGYFKFEFANDIVGNEINFGFSYNDETDKFHEEKYQFSLFENIISIVEVE